MRLVEFNKPTAEEYVFCLEDLSLNQIVLMPSGRKAKVLRLVSSESYSNSGTTKKDPFDRVHLLPLDACDDQDQVCLQPHMLRTI